VEAGRKDRTGSPIPRSRKERERLSSRRHLADAEFGVMEAAVDEIGTVGDRGSSGHGLKGGGGRGALGGEAKWNVGQGKVSKVPHTRVVCVWQMKRMELRWWEREMPRQCPLAPCLAHDGWESGESWATTSWPGGCKGLWGKSTGEENRPACADREGPGFQGER
jgi:hypothetical protein